jgi:hypothetical protein
MSIYISEDEKARHPYYTIMALKGDELLNELSKWSRDDLIDWLSWNDRNGVYRDEDSLREFDQIISREEALEIMVRQIMEA